MRGKSLALLALALGCGLVASLGIIQVLGKQQTSTPEETEPVLVAVKDIGMGDPLAKEAVKLEPWPKGKAPPGTIFRLEDIEGRRARRRIVVGEPILESGLLNKTDSAVVNSLIPKGYRVVSIRVDAVSSGGGLLMPGSRVDLLLHVTRNPGGGVPETTTRTILEDIRVFAVNDVVGMETGAPETKSIQARTVSLLVTPGQAEKITLASELGSIRLVMRPPEDEKARPRGATFPDLFGGSEGGNPKAETLEPAQEQQKNSALRDFLEKMRQQGAANSVSTPAAAPTPPPKRKWGCRVLKGAEVVDIEMEENDQVEYSNSEVSAWKVIGSASSGAKPDKDPVAVSKLTPGDDRSAKPDSKAPKAGSHAGKDDSKPAKDEVKPAKDGSNPLKDLLKLGKEDSKPGKDEQKAADNSGKN
jgi:pilus assembly protein CpaB